MAIKIVIPSKEFAQKHYHDLKERPFFNGLCDFLSSGPVIAMVRITVTLTLFITIYSELAEVNTSDSLCRSGKERE